jgi:hypothetical protein
MALISGNDQVLDVFTRTICRAGKLAEGSDKSGPMIGFWAQGWDKKNFLRLGPLLERKFQGKKPKSVVHLLLEK